MSVWTRFHNSLISLILYSIRNNTSNCAKASFFSILCSFYWERIWYVRSNTIIFFRFFCFVYFINRTSSTLLTNSSVRPRLHTIIIISSYFSVFGFRVRFHVNSARGRQRNKYRMEQRNIRLSIRWWDMIWDVRTLILKRRARPEKKSMSRTE